MFLTKQLLAFRPNKMDLIFAIKTFVAGMLALYIAFSLNLAYPIWAIGTVFVIANPYTGMTASKSMYRILGTLLGVIVAVAVTPILMNTPWLLTFFLATWVGCCLYISLLDRTPRSYVAMLAGYTTVIICYNAVYSIDTVSIFDMALGRFLEISLGVLCSAVITSTFFPLHLGPAVKTRVTKTLGDIETHFDQLFSDHQPSKSYAQSLSCISRDIADIHMMAIHLSYEKSTLKGMTKPLQEMLSQFNLVVSNLVAMSERLKQLEQLAPQQHSLLSNIHDSVVDFLKQQHEITEQQLQQLPSNFDQLFSDLLVHSSEEQQVVLHSLRMDIRHFIQNIHAIKFIWQSIQQGKANLPESLVSLGGVYPKLHRDHGVAVRGGLSAFLIVIISTGFWILSGWKAGFMLAEMAAISACILTAMDNPVPALKMFIRGNIYAGFFVFLYAYGVFPWVTEFWQLVCVLAPFIIYCLTLFPHPPLTGIGLPVLMGTIMGLNFQNSYHLDQILFFDATIGTIIGPIISVLIIHFVRAMSPDITAQRILSLHYRAIRCALYLPYGIDFKIHIRHMFDQIGVLNSKMVQSPELKQHVELALVEASTVIDLIRLQELNNRLDPQHPMAIDISNLQQLLDEYFCRKEMNVSLDVSQERIARMFEHLEQHFIVLDETDLAQRLKSALNNIQQSLCHLSFDGQTTQTIRVSTYG